ncbi:MAG: 4-(cytidine 5'-diphospho)-2-C-methyl-D-erythritol kinase [Alphaproteobacteria bacterium]
MSSPRAKEITVLAAAKVNLFLHIIGRREDGLHLLESLFAFADIGDRLILRKAEKLSFKVSGPFEDICHRAGCEGENNLVYRAAQELSKFAPGRGADITLEKNLPLSSGLGGGSADAAAVIKGLQILWGLEVDEDELFKMALGLGADVPACLLGVPCFVAGIGEDITPIDEFQPLEVVLVNPNRPLSTPQVFKSFLDSNRPFSTPLGLSPEFNQSQDKLLGDGHNDLQGPAIAILIDVAKILAALEGCEGCNLARMSGSGATCFGVFPSRDQSEKAAAWLAREHPKWWVAVTRLTERAPFLLFSG